MVFDYFVQEMPDSTNMSLEDDLKEIDDIGEISKAPLPNNNGASQSGLSSSEESRRSTKRKASFEEEDFIKRDPELYGLRRSVGLSITFGILLADSLKGSFTTKSSSGK